MSVYDKSLIAFGLVSLIYFLYIARRNERVCAFRCKMIDEDIEAYKRLPSYDDMLLKPWVKWEPKK